jgi:PmbA protein
MPSTKPTTQDELSLLGDLIARARKAGANAADAVLFEGTSVSLRGLRPRLACPDRQATGDRIVE